MGEPTKQVSLRSVFIEARSGQGPKLSINEIEVVAMSPQYPVRDGSRMVETSEALARFTTDRKDSGMANYGYKLLRKGGKRAFAARCPKVSYAQIVYFAKLRGRPTADIVHHSKCCGATVVSMVIYLKLSVWASQQKLFGILMPELYVVDLINVY